MSDGQQERYAAIERQYSQGQWQEVLSSSTALLAELPEQPGDPLRTRVILLQGHTLLYGLGQIAEAAAIYRQVLDSQPEPVLQSIAQQELERCLGSMAAAVDAPSPVSKATDQPDAGSAFPFAAQAVGSTPAGQPVSAMPWLDALGGVDPAATLAPPGDAAQPPWLTMASTPEQPPQPEPPAQALEPESQEIAVAPAASGDVIAADVIEEPEQIEVQQADPGRAEVVDLAPAAEPAMTPAAAALEAVEASSEPGKPRWSPAEEAELARGLLTVALR
ncbi:MAG: hypothetical protein FJ050_06545 [Cyanobacteria bacterium M_surface_7_m2_040]|nr:hypothetical protein [Cyanobacteria bacterium M_surface_7_m2_040]